MPAPLSHKTPRRIPRASGWIVALVAFVMMAPTLAWLEFSNGIEQLHAATVLELRRDGGSWVMPTLNGTLRIKKPPLPAWVGGLAVTDNTVAGVASADRAVRDAAYTRLAWEIRWPALLAGCLTLVATIDLARTLAGGAGRRRGLRLALLATVVAASSLLFLRYARLASTDVHLAFWVTTANALLARAILLRQRWCIALAGLAIGLGFMCKGPVAVLMTVVPFWMAWAWTALVARRSRQAIGVMPPGPSSSSSAPKQRAELELGGPGSRRIPATLAILAFLVVALPWPIMVAMSHEGALATWWKEIWRKDATDLAADPFWAYLTLLPHLLPWLPAFIVGVALTFRPRRRSTEDPSATATILPLLRHRGYLLAAVWLFVPIVVMSFFKDKNERYLLPLLPPAAILAARGLIALLAGLRRHRPAAGFWLNVQFALVAGFVFGLPLAGMISPASLPGFAVDFWPQTKAGGAWFTPTLGVVAVVIAGIGVAAIYLASRRRSHLIAIAIAAVLLVAGHALSLWGYRQSEAGLSEMRLIAERILAHRPGAVVAYFEPTGKAMPPDLSIYLNRVVRPLKAIRRAGEREPEVLVTLQRDGQPDPVVDGWRTFAKEPYGKRFWHAMERVSE